MNRIVLFLVSFLSLQGYENTPVMENNKDSQYSLCYEAKNEYYYSTTCIVYLQEKLNYIKQMENDKPLFIMFFYEEEKQIYFVVTDIKKNNIPVPQNSKGYCPGNIFELKGNCSCFYESGNKQESGICFYDEDPVIDYFEYGKWEKHEDFGESKHNRYETENSVIFETLLDGQLNGTQVFMSKEPDHVQRINYYEMGILKAQIIFDNDNQITKIVYEIKPDDDLAGYKCKYINYKTEGVKAKSCSMFFEGPLDGSEIQFP